MKKFLCGGVLVLSTAGAFANDLPARAPAYQAPDLLRWTGFYAGAHGGYGFGKNNAADKFMSFVAISGTSKPAGGFGGLQLGYNHQFAPHWMIGSEIDLSFGSIDASDALLPGVSAGTKIDSFGSARGRFGYVQDRALVYVTGGAAWMHNERTVSAPAAQVLVRNPQYHVGWVWGGGIEYAFDARWSFKLEYLYASFDASRDVLFSIPSSTSVVHSSDPALQIVRAGVNYRFGDTGASSAGTAAKTAPTPQSDWNGSYLGLHGGYGRAKVRDTIDIDVVTTPSFISIAGGVEPKGGFGGFQGGYNWVFAPQWLFGIEIDSSFGSVKGNGFELSSTFNGPPPYLSPTTVEIENLGTARLRLGYLAGNALFYATGGVAYARETSFLNDSVYHGFTTKADRFGWAAGGGVEWKFAPDWSAKIEYGYADLGTRTYFGSWVPLPYNITRSRDLTLQTVKFGLNYSGPVIERLFGGQ